MRLEFFRWDHWRIQIKSNFFLSSCGILSILASPTTWKRDFGPEIRVGWIFEVCSSRSKEGNFPPTIMVQRTIDPFKTIVSFTSKGGPSFSTFYGGLRKGNSPDSSTDWCVTHFLSVPLMEANLLCLGGYKTLRKYDKVSMLNWLLPHFCHQQKAYCSLVLRPEQESNRRKQMNFIVTH